MNDQSGIKGIVHAVWRNALGEITHESYQDNLVTQVGDQLYGERAVGITTLAVPTGMKLGTGSTAAAKTGAGAALVTYLSGSHQAFDGSFPASSLNGASRQIQYRVTYAAGTATTASNITEVVIVNDALTNATSAAAATIARALLSSPAPKAAGDILTITWNHDLLGA